jgi:hypothetical protein
MRPCKWCGSNGQCERWDAWRITRAHLAQLVAAQARAVAVLELGFDLGELLVCPWLRVRPVRLQRVEQLT